MYWIPMLQGQLAWSARPRHPEELRPFDLVVCLLEAPEIAELGLGWLKAWHLPVPDRGCPPDLKAVAATLDEIESVLNLGGKVLVHCRAGIGRSALLCACLLARRGEKDIWERLSHIRGVTVPDTPAQVEWWEGWRSRLGAAVSLDDALQRAHHELQREA